MVGVGKLGAQYVSEMDSAQQAVILAQHHPKKNGNRPTLLFRVCSSALDLTAGICQNALKCYPLRVLWRGAQIKCGRLQGR